MNTNVILGRTLASTVLYRPFSLHVLRQARMPFPKGNDNAKNKNKNNNSQLWYTKLNILKASTSKITNQYKRLKDSIQLANIKYKQKLKANDNNGLAIHDTKSLLPSEKLQVRKNTWSQKLEMYMDSLQETLFTASRAFNDVTGYSSIQDLRKRIIELETNLNDKKEQVKRCKAEYNDSIQIRLQSQHEVNELLTRKNSWNAKDLDRFTQLYKDDTINARKVDQLKDKLRDLETEADQINDKLYKSILTRYHEEQIWSDKIRSTSTWGTFTLMGINICLFLILQLLLEPWKRRKLTRAFEDKVRIAIETYSNDSSLQSSEILDMLHSAQAKIGPQDKPQRGPENPVVPVDGVTNGDKLMSHNVTDMLLTLWRKLKQFILVHPTGRVTLDGTELLVLSGGVALVSNLLLRLLAGLLRW